MNKHKITLTTATAIVIANMVGTGVFTSLGFQLFDLHNGFSILLLWIIGGVVALCGALCYGELAAALPRSGSEYHYLSQLYHPAVGFLSGFVSITVGFAAPIALGAILLGGYASKVFTVLDEKTTATVVILGLTAVHAYSVKLGSGVQNIFTALKVLLILFIVCAAFAMTGKQDISFLPQPGIGKEILSSGFAVALYWVSYSYSGWNASAYIAGEIQDPTRNVPRSLFRGTLFVTVLYVLLNAAFLIAAPMERMVGQKEVGLVAAEFIFGSEGGRMVGGIIALLLISSVSSMVIVGPRVTQVMGEDMGLLRFLARKNEAGIPWLAIITQSVIALVLVYTASFESILIYIGFTLNIFTFLTVLGLFILRTRKKQAGSNTYKAWGYPFTPIIFLGITGWILYKGFEMKPQESLIGLGTILSGLIIYFIDIFATPKSVK